MVCVEIIGHSPAKSLKHLTYLNIQVLGHQLNDSSLHVPLANDFFLGVVTDGVLVRDWCLEDLFLSRFALWRGDTVDEGDW